MKASPSMQIPNPGAQKSAGPEQHLYWLDWMRFLAALSVVTTHARGSWVEWGRLEPLYQTKIAAIFFALTRIGAESVTVFFVLSGFLVGGKVMDRVLKGSFDARSYAIDRFSRIWTPLIPSLLLTAAIAHFVGRTVSGWEFLGNLFGLQTSWCESFAGNVPLWSLAYEIWFYVLAGCAAVALTSRSAGRLWACLGLTLGMALFTRLETVFLFCWLLGAFGFGFRYVKRVRVVAFLGIALTGVGYVFSQLNTKTVSMDIHSLALLVPSKQISTLILCLGLALVLPGLIRLQPTNRFAASVERLGSRCAAFSYTLYLTHDPVIVIWEHLMPERFTCMSLFSILCYFAKVFSCLLVAWLLYLPFEARTATVRKWLRARVTSTTMPSSVVL